MVYGRTVRVEGVDGPQVQHGLSKKQPRTSSMHWRKMDDPGEHRRRSEPHELFDHPRQTVRPTPSNQNLLTRRIERSDARTHEEHDEQWVGQHLVDGPHGDRGLSARLADSSLSPTF
jgi:hypothetical protein